MHMFKYLSVFSGSLIVFSTQRVSNCFTFGSPVSPSISRRNNRSKICHDTTLWSDNQRCPIGSKPLVFSRGNTVYTSMVKNASEDLPNDGIRARGGGGDDTTKNEINILKRYYQLYINALEKNPMVVKSFSAGIINGIGDILSQFIQLKKSGQAFAANLSWGRVLSFVIVGWFYVGPFVHYWYEQLWKINRWQEKKYGTSKTKQALTSVFVDQTAGVALFFPFYFYVYELIEAFVGFRMPVWQTATDKVQKELYEVLLVQYKIWPLTNYINFSLVPENLRVLFSNIVSVFWNAFLCMKVA